MNKMLRDRTLDVMSMSNLISKGIEFMQNITDEDIEQLEGNGFMTKDFVQELTKRTREMSFWSFDEIIVFIQNNLSVWGNMNVTKAKDIAYNAITLGQLDEIYDEKENLCEELGCTEKEFDEIMEGNSAYDEEE